MKQKSKRILKKLRIMRILAMIVGSFIAFLTVMQLLNDGGSLLNILPGLPNEIYDLLASNPSHPIKN